MRVARATGRARPQSPLVLLAMVSSISNVDAAMTCTSPALVSAMSLLPSGWHSSWTTESFFCLPSTRLRSSTDSKKSVLLCVWRLVTRYSSTAPSLVPRWTQKSVSPAADADAKHVIFAPCTSEMTGRLSMTLTGTRALLLTKKSNERLNRGAWHHGERE